MIAQKPNALTRLKAAVQFYKDGWRKFDLRPRETKTIPFIWPSWYNNQPQWQLINYEAYANEGYNANAVIYSAIMYKVRSITIAPLKAYAGTKEEPELLDADHPLQKLCSRPNRFQSWSEFQALATVYFNLSGNNYTVLERDGDQVVGMYHLRPDRVFIIPTADKEHPIGFWYVPEAQSWVDGIPYVPQDVIHFKLPNPMDPLDGLGYGISPLSPAAHSGDVDNDLTKFFRLFFKGGAMPPGVLSYDVPMMDDDVSRARERWMEIYGGYENWKDVAVLDQGGTYEKVGFTFQEMDVSAIDARNESRIVAPFGVPLNLIESRPTLVQSTYNNKREDRTMFWEDTMTPELLWFETDYQYYLQGSGGEFVQFDLSKVPALTMTQTERVDKFHAAHNANAVTTDEYRAELGLDPMDGDEITTTDDIEGDNQQVAISSGDKPSNLESTSGLNGAQIQAVLSVLEQLSAGGMTGLVATELITSVGVASERAKRIVESTLSNRETLLLDEPPKPPQEQETEEGQPEAEEEAERSTNGRVKKKSIDRLKFWTKADSLATRHEAEFGEAAARAFEQDAIYVEATINDANTDALENRASLNWETVIVALGAYFGGTALENWQRQFTLPMYELMAEMIVMLDSELGQTITVADVLAGQWFNEYTIQFAQPINVTTEEAIRRLIEQANAEGWSVPTTQKNLKTMFQQWMQGDLTQEAFEWLDARMPDFRRELIARTETMRASNTVSYRLYGEWGVEEHEWLATRDDRVRPAHADADGQVVKVGSPFKVGGESLLYPHDPNGSAGNTINCRCTTIPII